MSPKPKAQSPRPKVGPGFSHPPSRFTFHVLHLRLQRSNAPTLARSSSAFTLIEIMIVVAIMLIVMGMSIPFAKQAIHREALSQAVRDIEDVCGTARERAIFQGSMAQLVFRAADNSLAVEGASAAAGEALGGTAASGQSVRFSDKVVFETFKINGINCMEMEEARVRFFPNGTCDDMIMIVRRVDGHERFELYLEVTTGLLYLESDPNKFRTKS